jgi:hypothetical protein
LLRRSSCPQPWRSSRSLPRRCFACGIRSPHDGGFRALGHPASTLLFTALLLAVIAVVAFSAPLRALAGFAVVLLGLPAYQSLEQRRLSAIRW